MANIMVGARGCCLAGLLGRMQDWDRVEDHPDPVHPIHLRETEDEKASSKSIEKHIFPSTILDPVPHCQKDNCWQFSCVHTLMFKGGQTKFFYRFEAFQKATARYCFILKIKGLVAIELFALSLILPTTSPFSKIWERLNGRCTVRVVSPSPYQLSSGQTMHGVGLVLSLTPRCSLFCYFLGCALSCLLFGG